MAIENLQTYNPESPEKILSNAEKLKKILKEIEDCRLTQKQMLKIEFIPLDLPSTSKI